MIFRKVFLTYFLILNSFISFSQKDSSLVKFVNPPSVVKPIGYSHTVIIDLGNSSMVILSGQVPLDVNGILVGKGDFKIQAEQVFINIGNIVSDLDVNMDYVIRIGIYMAECRSYNFQKGEG